EIFDDDDGFEALNVEVTNISNPALIASAEINGAQLLIGLNPVPGITNIALKATDATLGFAETVVQIEILAATQHGLPVVHINAGGAGVQTGGHSWIADQ